MCSKSLRSAAKCASCALDVDYGGSEIIGDRAFSGEPEVIAALGGAFIQGMHAAGMAATGKHFPGHGYVAEDSHIAKPVDRRSLADIRRSDLQPFVALMEQGLDAVMPAHVVYEQVDSLPAGFSRRWVEEILRGELGFDGVVFSDDLSMHGADLQIGFVERANLALNAGCDMVLVCNNSAAAEQVVETLRAPEHWSERRLQTMRGQFTCKQLQNLQTSQAWQTAQACLATLQNR